MQRRKLISMAIAVLCCSCQQRPQATPPTGVNETTGAASRVTKTPSISPEDEREIRDFMEKFLSTRWAYDADRTEPLLSAVDRENLDNAAFFDPRAFLPPSLVPDDSVPDHKSWKIGDVQLTDDDHASVRVRLALPSYTTMLQARMRTIMRSNRAGTPNLHEVMKGDAPAATPDRQLMSVRYRLVREAGEWRVFMGWAAKEESIASGTFDPTNFSGSEAAILIEKAELAELKQPKQEPGDPEIVRAIRDAERALRDERFDSAHRQYTRLLDNPDAPSFLEDRLQWIQQQKKRIEERDATMAAIDVEWDAPRRVRTEEREKYRKAKWLVPVTLTNRSEMGLRSVSLSVEAQDRKHPFPVVGLAVGKSVDVDVPLSFYEGSGEPRVKNIELWHPFPEERGRWSTPKSDFRERLKIYETGRPTLPSPSQDGGRTRRLEGKLRTCDGWPEERVDLAVTIGEDGTFEAVEFWSTDAPDSLVRCVEEVLGSADYVAGRERTTVVEIPPAPKLPPR